MAGGPCPLCQCIFGDTNCFHFTGRGQPEDPYVLEARLDEDTDNLFECRPGGFGAWLPPEIIEPPVVHAYSTIDQTIATEAEQILFFNDTRYDTDGMHDKNNEQSRITIKTPGVYLVTVNVLWDKNTEGDRALYLRKNSGEYLDITTNGEMGVRVIGMNSTVTAEFEVGDYVEALVKHDAFTVNDDNPFLKILSQRYTPNFTATYMRQAS